MAVIITDAGTPTGTFSIDGKVYNKIYQPLDGGSTSIRIVNSYDTRFVLMPSTAFADITVNGSTYGTQALTLSALSGVVYEPIVSGGGGGSVNVWGDITGTLSNQTDLQAALDAKQAVGAFAAWADITGKPTTIAGFGITDAFEQVDADALYLPLAGTAVNSNLLDGYNSATASTISTVAVRDGSGDINARLFRSEYDTTNGTVGYIMTQVDTATNNYIRPSTPAQFRAAVTDASYLGIAAKAADSNLLDGLDSSVFVRSNTADTVSGVLTFSARPAFNVAGAPFSVTSTTVIPNLNADLLDGLQATSFLRSDQADETTGALTAASFITGSWTIDQSGTDLVFKYAGSIMFKLSSTGELSVEGDGNFFQPL